MILLTGATGFIGSNLVKSKAEFKVLCRESKAAYLFNKPYLYNGDYTDLPLEVFKNCDTVIHLAGLAHNVTDDAIAINQINHVNTVNLARRANEAGVSKFIFLSSTNVNRDLGLPRFDHEEEEFSCYQDHFSLSKYKAELSLREFSLSSDIDITIIRSPLVYGPGVKANFLKLIKIASLGIPLPFGGLDLELRSLVNVDNLTDLILECVSNPKAANKTFLVSDDNDLSLRDIFLMLGHTMNKDLKLITLPKIFLSFVFVLLGKRKEFIKFTGSHLVDISETKRILKWKPTHSVMNGFKNTYTSLPKQ